MTRYTLTLFDTTGIQDYIFGSNRLQENIGASEIVYRATTLWVFEALNKLGLRHNIKVLNWEKGLWEYAASSGIEHDDALDVEVIFAGGGNTLLLTRNPDGDQAAAIRFTRTLTRRIVQDAPGLNVVAQHFAFDWDAERLTVVHTYLLQAMARHKQSRLPSAPLLGLAVSARCQSTGLVAVQNNEARVDGEMLKMTIEEETRLISRETVAKLVWRNRALDRLKATVGRDVQGAFDFPSDIDNLGRIHGQESYVAVIHADGNRMGEHVKNVAGKIDYALGISDGNRRYVDDLRLFSQSVDAAGIEAMGDVVNLVARSIKWSELTNRWQVSDSFQLVDENLPLRPLVFGGDDVTFLTNGLLGMTLATAYLNAFEARTREQGLPAMHASAGVAMVKMHYPFARAYQLSEALCGSAKAFVREQGGQSDFSALDWHFATSGLSGALNVIRGREYTVPDGELWLRPLRLRAESNVEKIDGRYWEDGVERVIREFQMDKPWIDQRNKVKGLYAQLRRGPDGVRTYRETYGLDSLPTFIPGNTEHTETGWSGKKSTHFDAIELLDHYIPQSKLEAVS